MSIFIELRRNGESLRAEEAFAKMKFTSLEELSKEMGCSLASARRRGIRTYPEKEQGAPFWVLGDDPRALGSLLRDPIGINSVFYQQQLSFITSENGRVL